MRSLALILSLSAGALAFAPVAIAQTGQGYATQVNVTIGPLLASKARSFGPRELDYLTVELRRTVVRAVSHSSAPPQRVDLVIEDAQPNRPTFEQLGRTIGLSLQSVGLGGAQVSGTVVGPDGAPRLLRYQYYENDLTQEIGATTWSDAERVFDKVASQIRNGRISVAYRGLGPSPRGGEFGYPIDSH